MHFLLATEVIESRKGQIACLSDCAVCPPGNECTQARTGRAVSIDPHEPEIAAEQKKQSATEFYAQRSAAERSISQMTRHGSRDAKNVGSEHFERSPSRQCRRRAG